jgi:hypothetical protein
LERYLEAFELNDEFLDVLIDSLLLASSDAYDKGEFLVSWLYVWFIIMFIYSDSYCCYTEF